MTLFPLVIGHLRNCDVDLHGEVVRVYGMLGVGGCHLQ